MRRAFSTVEGFSWPVILLVMCEEPSARKRPDRRKLLPLSRRRRKWVSRDVSCFSQQEQIGEGTYGYVHVISVDVG